MKLENIKHIFFDLDHTLWDFETNSKKSYEFIFAQNDIDIPIDDFLKVYIPMNFHYWKLYREEKITKNELKYKRLRDVFDKLNYGISDELISKLAEEYLINLANYNQLFEGTVELLDYLKPKYKLHIITNGFKETQYAKMEKSGILHYFDEIITSESVGVKKPNPEIFFYALKKANARTYESVMIGDSLEADVYGAKNMGMPAIYFDPENINSDTNLITLRKLIEIKKYL